MTGQMQNVLVVDDEAILRRLVATWLKPLNVKVHQAHSGTEALAMAARHKPDAILLDLELPDMDGFEVCRQLKQLDTGQQTPVLFVTANADPTVRTTGYEAGGSDFLTKPLIERDLQARVRSALQTRALLDALRKQTLTDPLTGLANRDGLRQCLNDTLARYTDHAEAAPLNVDTQHADTQHADAYPVTGSETTMLAVLSVNLRGFHRINDSLGHAVGDQVLKTVARRLALSVRMGQDTAISSPSPGSRHTSVVPNAANHMPCQDRDEVVPGEAASRERFDLVARIGGDHFAVMLDASHDADLPDRVAQRVINELAQPLLVDGGEVRVQCSLGVRWACIDDATDLDAEDLLQDSQTAMAAARHTDVGKWVTYKPAMRQKAVDRMKLEQDLRQAIRTVYDQVTKATGKPSLNLAHGGELRAAYQPIVDLLTGRVKGFEALSRWVHPELGSVSPQHFVSVAEETEIIHDLGRWILREAALEARKWAVMCPGHEPFVGVNLSRRQIESPTLLDDIDRVLQETGVSPRNLKLEVTETVIVHNSGKIVPVLETLKQRGFRLAMDDFGTGESSLACLHLFPMDTLKIDKAFITTMERDRRYGAIVDAVVTLAHNLNMDVIAEGIETEGQVVQLQAYECDYGQGYYFDQPLSAQDATRCLTDAQDSPGRALSA